jgi:response regulator RpfG family c-di-GMP phosphodiesterase/signal transduction histidine kinase
MSLAGLAGEAEISCRLTINLFDYFESLYGPKRTAEVLASLNSGTTLEELRDPARFISFDLAARLFDGFADASGDPDFSFNSGLRVTSPQALGFLYYMFRALASPEFVFRKFVELGPTVNRVGSFKIDELTSTRIVLRYHSTKKEPSRRLCECRIGQFASCPQIFGQPRARAVERECQVNGAPDCVYELTWQPHTRPIYSSAIGGLAGGLTSAAMLWHVVGPVGGSALGLAVGGSLGLALGYRTQSKQKSELLAAQDAGVNMSLGDLRRQFDEIQKLNLGLEAKVEERTKELSVATTRLQAALEKQMELDRLKTRFFQNISHELRTPLTLILAPLDSLTSEPGLPKDMRLQLDVMRRSAVRLLSMINSLLDLSRLEAGKMRLSLEDMDPAFACRQLVEGAQQLAVQRHIELRYIGPERMPEVPLDQEKFDKIVLNLISNALKFTNTDHGRPAIVDVILTDEGGKLNIAVKDTGIGIPAAEIQNLFQRFHQVDGSDERKYGGTGIGLALVKELIEFHLGEVKVESKENVGSTFTVSFPLSRDAYPDERLDRRRERMEVVVDRRSLEAQRTLSQLITNSSDLALADLQPAADAEEVVEEQVPSIVPGGTREKLLLADDNADMLAYLATILRRDYDVITAVDGEEAFDLALQHLPQVIVSDVMMPRKNGYALVRDLKRTPATRSIPVILVTAKADSYGKVAGIESGADDYLTKPFNFLELRARIRQLLKTRALERSLSERNDYLSKLNFDLVLSKKEVFLQTIEALAFALEAKDAYTHGHSRRVALLSTELGQKLSLTELEVERVRIAAVLHDIGKLGIPEHILHKEGKLSPLEQEIIQRHPEIGYRILESVSALTDVNRCILLHHEKFDGSGYPLRKTSLDIPLESRIIAVADTYDAMTSDRPYRLSLGHARAIAELKNFSGTQFDPECVRAFLALYEATPPSFPDFPSVFPKIQPS